MICTVEVRCNAANPNLPLKQFVSFKGSPSSIRVLDVPKKIGEWNITNVYVQVKYPDDTTISKECVRNGSVWIGTVDGTSTIGTSKKGFSIVANGIDENGEVVEGYVLGVGDVVIMDMDGIITPGETTWSIHLYDSQPENPKKGDAYFENDTLKIYDGTQWKDVGGIDLTNYIHSGNNWMKEGIRYKKVVLYNSTEQAQQTNVSNTSLSPGSIELDSGTNKGKNTLSYHSMRLDEQGSTTTIPDIEIGVSQGRLSIASGMVDLRYIGPEDNWFRIKGFDILTNADVMLDETRKGYVALANHADYSDDAGSAGSAEMANKDSSGNVITSTYATKNEVKNNKITITQGGVEKGSFTLNQATDKTIELDAGGGGGDTKCLLFVQHNGNSSQYAQWTAKGADGNNHTYKVTRYYNAICLYKDGSIVAIPYSGGTDMLIPVEGNVFVHADGYDGDSIGLLDNEPISLNWRNHDTTGHHTMSIIFGDCLEQSTPISMADGTTKAVGELKVGDKVLTLNPDTLQLEEDEVSDCDAGMVKMYNKMDVWNFADGTSIKTIKPHQFFNTRTNKMEYIADFQIGDGVRKQDGTTTTLTGHETKMGVFFHNTLYTKKFNNYFANGILTGNRHSKKWGWYYTQHNQEG